MRIRRRTLGKVLLGAAITGAVTLVASNIVVYVMASGRQHSVSAVSPARVVIVPGAEVRDGQPRGYLRGRLDTALELYRAGKVERFLVSGDALGRSGDEIAVMTAYLTSRGIPRTAIDEDPRGVSTHASCARALEVFHYSDAIIVTQRLHVARAVALCQAAGLNAAGVPADCNCTTFVKWRNAAREWLAAPKAVAEMLLS